MSVDFSIFAKLWKSSDTGSFHGKNGKDTLYVPHTIVFMDGVPFAWYFTSLVDGRYKRRSKRKLITDEIYEHFKKLSRRRARTRARNSGLAGGGGGRGGSAGKTKKKGKGQGQEQRKSAPRAQNMVEDSNTNMLAAEHVVAVWVQNVMSAGKTSGVRSKYMNLQELKHFLFSEHKGQGAGMLQQVIHMHGNIRRAVCCHWSPHISTVEMCVNKWTITNGKIHINVRMADVHAGRGNMVITRLDQSTKLGTRIKSLSDTLSARIEEIANTSRDGRLLFDPSKMNHPYEKAVPPPKILMTPKKIRKRRFSNNNDGEGDGDDDDDDDDDDDGEEQNDNNEQQEAEKQNESVLNSVESQNYCGVYQNSLQRAYLDPFLRNATFSEKRNLLGVRLHSATFNFTIGDDNRTYLGFCTNVQMVDSQPAHQKRKKRSR